MTHQHPVNQAMQDRRSWADAAVGRFVGVFGSLPFLAWQTVVIIAWVAFNVVALTGRLHFDRYPFILLNLLFSTQAAYAAPLILLAQNRQDEADRRTREHDYGVNETALAEIRSNTELTAAVRDLIGEVHQTVCGRGHGDERADAT